MKTIKSIEKQLRRVRTEYRRVRKTYATIEDTAFATRSEVIAQADSIYKSGIYALERQLLRRMAR
jgi:hypothetical protein